jgi:hypothetical protein
MYYEIPADVLAQSLDAKDAAATGLADAKDFIIGEAQVDGLLPLREAVYATRGLKVDPTGQHATSTVSFIGKSTTAFDAARKFITARNAAAKTAKSAIAIWAAVEAGRAARAERDAKHAAKSA